MHKMSFTEKSLVEDHILQKLKDKGWTYTPAENLERESFEEPLLNSNLVRALEKLNRNLSITEEEIKKVINELKLLSTGIEGAKKVLNFLKFGVPIKFDKDRIVKFVRLIDHEIPEKNEFICTRQVRFQGRDQIRTDIILYVNGIPLVNIECKNPANIAETWMNAYTQIKDYEKSVPELYKYVQIGVAAANIARYFPIVTWADEVRTHEWKTPEMDSIGSLIEILARETLLDIVRNFLFFRVEMGNATKVISRYMQYRAANRMVDRVHLNLNEKDKKNKGLIWHWQGSGKTLTMIFASHKLYFSSFLGNPTLFFMVDRIELEDQLYQEFNALDIAKPEIIGSITALKKILCYDDYRGKRGLFIVLIHKFRPEELRLLQMELEEVSKHKETIMTRRNVVAFIDEGHRTQYGLLAGQMKAILKKAFFFAMTGTPIAKHGRDTYSEFSYPPEESYLDRYFITDSIKDGFTVKIAYQPRLEKDVHLRKELLESFLKSEFEEIPEQFRENVKEEVRKRLNVIRLVLEDPQRIKVIAQDIAEHFKENMNGKFKALVVAGSREACAMYKGELDKHFPAKYAEVVVTYDKKDRGKRKNLFKYVVESRARYGNRDFKDIRKDYVGKFKEDDFPRMLIVTDMLLTGFDVPILQTIYLDKPLKEHRLLQAVARTNRPYKGIKEAGMVIDYVGVLKEFKKALAMYSVDDIKGALLNLEELKEEFMDVLKDMLVMFLEIPQEYTRESLLKAVELITLDTRSEDEFVTFYKKLRKLFELLGPSELKVEFFEEYKWLSGVYSYYLKLVRQKTDDEAYIRKYFDKTVKFVHEATEIKELEQDQPIIAFDEFYLEKLEERIKSMEEKAANILFVLNRLVLVDRHKNPIYESIIDKVERLLEMWKEKNRDYERIYTKGKETFGIIQNLLARQQSLGFSDMEYSLLLELEKQIDGKEELPGKVKDFSAKIERLLFSGWIHQVTVKKEVERELRRFVRGLKAKYGLSMEEMNDLHHRLIENIKNYGN